MSKDSRKLPSGGARVRVTHAGLCGSDLHRLPMDASTWPAGLGHEVSGVVEEVAGSAELQPGDRVAVIPLLWCGRCYRCLSGRLNLCLEGEAIGRTRPGGFGREVMVPDRNCHRIPDTMSLETAALADVVAVCVHALNVSGYRPGQTALVIGDGAVGLTMAAILRRWGAPVAVSSKHPENLELITGLAGD